MKLSGMKKTHVISFGCQINNQIIASFLLWKMKNLLNIQYMLRYCLETTRGHMYSQYSIHGAVPFKGCILYWE